LTMILNLWVSLNMDNILTGWMTVPTWKYCVPCSQLQGQCATNRCSPVFHRLILRFCLLVQIIVKC
jgi:hypothetical protein